MKTILIMCTFALGNWTMQVAEKVYPTTGTNAAHTVKIDPICKMKVKAPAAHSSTYQKQEYWFCSKTCKSTFNKHPEKYVAQ
jgi:YHS domain-containing protein